MAETVNPDTIKNYGLKQADVDLLNALYAQRDAFTAAITPLSKQVSETQEKITKFYTDAKIRKNLAGPWFKWIRPGGVPTHVKGAFKYDLPHGHPGKWHKLPNGKSPVVCAAGFHVVKADRIDDEWKKPGANLYLVEVAGKAAHDYNKSAFSEIRVMKRVTQAQAKALAAKA